MKRYAIVKNARTRREVEAYLPDNYRVIHLREDVERPNRSEYVIQGEDSAGWTLDGYVIPRYASGLIWAEEIDLSHPIMKEVPLTDPADDDEFVCDECGERWDIEDSTKRDGRYLCPRHASVQRRHTCIYCDGSADPDAPDAHFDTAEQLEAHLREYHSID